MKLSSIPAVLLVLSACTPPGPQTCKLTDATTCTNGQVCERVKGKGNPYCFQPILLTGTVKVFGTTTAIGNAEIVAVDTRGVPVGPAVKSDSDGTWKLRVETERSDAEKGAPIFRTVTLRAAAQDFLAFPAGVRSSLPIDTSGAKAPAEDKPLTFASALTDLTLTALPDAEKGFKGVSGTVELATGDPALVVLEGTRTFVTAPDSTGAFHLLNVPAGNYKAQAYAKGANYTAADVVVAAGAETTNVSVKKNSAASATGTISGTVQLAPGSNGAGTGVVLVIESTFIEVLGRGEQISSLRAPETGTPNITGPYSIAGIPDGKYVALVGFETDGNVRDPDPAIAVAQLARVTVTAGVASAMPVFRAVGAVEVISPGGVSETVEEVAGSPTFTWTAYPTATSYELVVYSTLGTKVWENQTVLNNPNAAGKITAAYSGLPLKPGVVYQWKVTARTGLLPPKPISLTEDLKGLFSVK